MLHHPFDRELGIEAAGFRHGRLRLVHPARMRVGGRQGRVDVIYAQARVDRLVTFVDRCVEMAKAELRFARVEVKNADSGVARAQPIARSMSAFDCSKRPREFSAMARGI